MRVRRFQLYIALLWCLMPGISLASNSVNIKPNDLTWIKWEQKPIFAPYGSEEEQHHAIYESIIRLIHEQPEFQHWKAKGMIVNHSRFNIVASELDNCYVGWQTFHEVRIASQPITIIRPWVLWTLKTDAEKFGAPDKPVSLKKILADGQYKIAGIKGFSYSEKIKNLIDEYTGKKNLFLTPAFSIEVNPQLLTMKRVDALLGNPGQMQYLEGSTKPEVEYVSFNLEEEPYYTPMVVSCSDTKKGRKVIRSMNDILATRGKTFLETVLSFHKKWHGEVTAEFESIFKTYIIERKPHPLILEKPR